jgi:hypothetical protein
MTEKEVIQTEHFLFQKAGIAPKVFIIRWREGIRRPDKSQSLSNEERKKIF